jgi:hypothetical protein
VADRPQLKTMACSSARKAAVVAANTDAVPATSTQTPGRTAPQERKLAAVSPQPATTGTPGARPQAPASSGASVPTTSWGAAMRGSFVGSTSNFRHSASSHRPAGVSANPEKWR